MLKVDDLEMQVTRKRQKNMYVRVKPPDGHIVVTAPLYFTDDEIVWFIREKKNLILKHQRQVREKAQQMSGTLDGAESSSAGQGAVPSGPTSETTSSDSSSPLRPVQGVGAPTQAEIEEWRAVVKAFVPPLIEKWAPIIGVKPGKLAYRNMVSRWGSCNVKTGRICINVQLAAHPPECLEYVVVHELCHLVEPNHGPRFKALLDSYLPHWREAEAKLKGGIRR